MGVTSGCGSANAQHAVGLYVKESAAIHAVTQQAYTLSELIRVGEGNLSSLSSSHLCRLRGTIGHVIEVAGVRPGARGDHFGGVWVWMSRRARLAKRFAAVTSPTPSGAPAFSVVVLAAAMAVRSLAEHSEEQA